MPNPIVVTLQSATSVDETPGVVLGPAILAGRTNHSVYIVGSSGVASGAVTFETAHDPDYTGTWDELASAVTVVADTVDRVSLSNTALAAARCRISTVIASGTVTVIYVGH